MRLETADGRSLWLTYCMNVHPGGDVASQRRALETTVVPLRERLGLDGPFGVGLRFDEAGAQELAADPQPLADTLERHALVPFTANGFVMGRFHGRPVKEKVYLPTWASRARLEYTVRLAEGMADLARATRHAGPVSISTSPLAWRAGCDAAMERRVGARHLAEAARALADLRERKGVDIRLGLEPEPGCVLDRTEDAASFIGGDVRDALGPDEAAFRHLGLCYDVCHQAVMHEDVASGIEALARAGVPMAKAQLTCAVEAGDPSDAGLRETLRAFDEPTYLHQVGAPTSDGTCRLVSDLGEALEVGSAVDGWTPWRIHFHVPVFRRALVGGLEATRRHLDALLELVARRDVTPHLEIETYTFDVIPEAEKRDGSGFDLVDALEREVRSVLAGLAAHGVRPVDRAS